MFKSEQIAGLFCFSNILVGMVMGIVLGAGLERFTENKLDKAAIKYLKKKIKEQTCNIN